MMLIRWLILLPLLVAIGAFIAYAVTGRLRYRLFGLRDDGFSAFERMAQLGAPGI